MEIVDFLIRIAVGMGLAAVLGIEREASGKAAGLRTYAMVGLGAAVFTVISMEAFQRADESRVAAQIVSGIGFLGAGAIFRSGPLIRGLTTAAGLWAAAAVGMAAGTGQLMWALVATVIAMVVLAGLRFLDPLLNWLRRTVELEASVTPAEAFLQVRERISDINPEIDLLDVRRERDDTVVMRFAVSTAQQAVIQNSLEAMQGVLETRLVGEGG